METTDHNNFSLQAQLSLTYFGFVDKSTLLGYLQMADAHGIFIMFPIRAVSFININRPKFTNYTPANRTHKINWFTSSLIK